MAYVRDQHLGVIQGALGPQVFKNRRGKSYVAQLPHSSGKTPSVNVINVRKKFGVITRFAKSVNSIPALKTVWDIATPDNMSPFNGIFKTNYSNVTTSDVLSTALIVPRFYGFGITSTDLTVDETSINLSIDPIGTDSSIDTNVEKFIQLCAVLKCTDPSIVDSPGIIFAPVMSSNVILNLANPLSFTIEFKDFEQAIYEAYDTHLTFLALVTLDADGKAIHYSEELTA
ncbi:MAG: hypothetical protein WC139_04905 [Candidatus Kapaibacterium sp.]